MLDLRRDMEWELDPNFVEGEKVVLRLKRYNGRDYFLEDEKEVVLRSGDSYTLTSKTIPVEDVEILVTDDNGEVIDEKRGYPEYSVFIYQPDGRTRYAAKSTRALRKGKLWELNPNFVEGEEAVILLRL